MSFTLSEQLLCIAWSVVCGAFIGLIYDLFRIIRLLVFKGKVASFICDFLFMVTAAFISVIFSMGFSRGNTRYFIVAGELCGLLLVRLTLGRVSIRIIEFLSRKISALFKKTSDKIGKISKKVLQVVSKILYNIIRKIKTKGTIRRGREKYETEASE